VSKENGVSRLIPDIAHLFQAAGREQQQMETDCRQNPPVHAGCSHGGAGVNAYYNPE
jgi:hypothetical protein